MAISLKHTTQAVGTDAGNGEIRKAQWNEEHTLTLAENTLLGRYSTGTGVAEEVALGTGLSITNGVLNSTAANGDTTLIFQTNTTDFKDSVQAATTSNINLSNPGTAVFDGITLTAGDRLLVKNQNTGSQNGIYTFDTSSTALTRATDADEDAEVTSGLLVLCEDGDTQSNTLFTLTTPDPISVGSTALTFESIVLPSNPEIVKEVKTATYTLVATDPNKWLKMNRATAQTITVPGASTKIPTNSVIYIQQYGAGAVTLSAAGGVTIRAPQGLVTNTQYSVIRLKKIGNNEWTAIITGNATSGTSLLSSKSSDFTFDLSQVGALVNVNSGSAVVATIPPNSSVAFPLGTRIKVLRGGAGSVKITPGSGVTLRLPTGIKPSRLMGARVKKSADQNGVSYSGGAYVAWDAETFDTDAFHDTVTANTKITIPTGLGIKAVNISGNVLIGALTAGQFTSLTVHKNGNAVFDGASSGDDNSNTFTNKACFVSATAVKVTDSDYFEVLFSCGDTSINVVAANSSFALEVTEIDAQGWIASQYGAVEILQVAADEWVFSDQSSLG